MTSTPKSPNNHDPSSIHPQQQPPPMPPTDLHQAIEHHKNHLRHMTSTQQIDQLLSQIDNLSLSLHDAYLELFDANRALRHLRQSILDNHPMDPTSQPHKHQDPTK